MKIYVSPITTYYTAIRQTFYNMATHIHNNFGSMNFSGIDLVHLVQKETDRGKTHKVAYYDNLML